MQCVLSTDCFGCPALQDVCSVGQVAQDCLATVCKGPAWMMDAHGSGTALAPVLRDKTQAVVGLSPPSGSLE